MYYAKWNNKKYKLLDSIEINKSSKEITYSNIKVDFDDCTIDDLPYAQQEVKIYDEDNLKFTGYLADYRLPKLTNLIESKELEVSLFSPMQLTTKRTVTIVRTDKIENIINSILAPLFTDGFVLKELNTPEKTITVKIISRTVEEILNYFSNKYSFFWYIDEFKNITINSIEYLFNKPYNKIINMNNYKEEINGFLSITPVVQNSDYANIINVKNARIFYAMQTTNNVTLKKGDTLIFENPVDVSYETATRIFGSSLIDGASGIITNLEIVSGNLLINIISGFNTSGGIEPGLNYNNIGKTDDENKLFTLQMDNMFKNLATGVKYNGETNIVIEGVYSGTALEYSTMKLINWKQVDEYTGLITPSGQVEKNLDVKNGWFTSSELIDYIRSLFIINNKQVNSVIIEYDEENSIKIGDKIIINLTEYFVSDYFIVTSIKELKQGNNSNYYIVELKSTNLLENYVNLFRSSFDIEEQESQTQIEYVVEYIEEETIIETHEIEVDDGS